MPNHLLVLSDTPVMGELLHDIFVEEAHQVMVRPYHNITLDAIQAMAPDALILDEIFRPDSPTWALLASLKRQPRTRTMPTLVCTTSRQMLETLGGALEPYGIFLVLKPFDLDDIHLALLNALTPA